MKQTPHMNDRQPLTLWLPPPVLQSLEELRRALGKDEVTQVAEEALVWYLRLALGRTFSCSGA